MRIIICIANTRFLSEEFEANLEGKTPSNGRREDPAALPPLLGRGMKPRPATKGATPPWNPLERFICPVACHGAYEPLVNPSVEQTLTTWAAALGIKSPPGVVRDKDGVKIVRYGRETDNVALTALYIEGQGHGWPGGGNSNLPERWIGPRIDRIHATDIIWDFFKKFSRK